MKVISLGHACQVKFNIDRLFKEQETHFFDWLITDFKSVLYLLNSINNENFFNKLTFTEEAIFMPGKSWDERYHKIECVEFKMISIHDFPSNIPYLDYIEEFKQKYNRRIDRLKNFINSGENIHMIHCIDHQFTEGYIITNDDISNYKKYLCDVNNNNNCFLHIVIPPKYKDIDFNYLIQDKVYVYYLHYTAEGNNDWSNTNFNWSIIFDNINNIG